MLFNYLAPKSNTFSSLGCDSEILFMRLFCYVKLVATCYIIQVTRYITKTRNKLHNRHRERRKQHDTKIFIFIL